MLIQNNSATRPYTIGGVSIAPGAQANVPDEYYDDIQGITDLQLIGTPPVNTQAMTRRSTQTLYNSDGSIYGIVDGDGKVTVTGKINPFTVAVGQSYVFAVKEGDTIKLTGNATAVGTLTRAGGIPVVIGVGERVISAMSGVQTYTLSASAGSIDATVGAAVLGLAGIEGGTTIKKEYRSNLLNVFADGAPRGIAKGASVGAMLVECSRSYTSWGGAPTLSVVNGLNQTGAGAGTPIGVAMDLANGLTGTPVSKTGMPSMLKVVTTTTADAVSWKCILSNGNGITSAGAAAAILNGNFGFWVWIARLPGQDIGGTPAGQLQFTLTGANGGTGGTQVSFNNLQLKEGWNFLKFQDTRNTDASGTHPLGISAAFSGDANDPFLAANAGAIRNINVNITGFPIGTTLIFDSAWTGIVSRPALVLGFDNAGNDLIAYAVPKMQQYGFTGYLALPRSVQISAYGANVDRANVVADYRSTAAATSVANAFTVAGYGWEIINHTMTHPNPTFPNMNGITAPEDIRYEVTAWLAWARGLGLPTSGSEFYAAPQGAASRLSEMVIKQAGIKLQRVYTQQNVQRTPWGIPNPHSIGAIDFGDQTYGNTFARLKQTLDQIIAYGDVGFFFGHIIVTAGDPGDGTGLTGNSLQVFKSTWDMWVDYAAGRVAANACDVISISEFYYGP